jgi:hypothetical protein
MAIISRVEIEKEWQILHDYLLLPCGRPILRLEPNASRLIGQVDKRRDGLFTITDQVHIQLHEHEEPSSKLEMLAKRILQWEPVAFYELATPRDPLLKTVHIWDRRSPLKARLIVGRMGIYPPEGFAPFETIRRWDVLFAADPAIDRYQQSVAS